MQLSAQKYLQRWNKTSVVTGTDTKKYKVSVFWNDWKCTTRMRFPSIKTVSQKDPFNP